MINMLTSKLARAIKSITGKNVNAWMRTIVRAKRASHFPKGTPMGKWEARFARTMVRIQAFTFFPVMLLIARASLLVNMLIMMFVTNKVPSMQWQSFHQPTFWKWADRIAVLGHIAWVYIVFG